MIYIVKHTFYVVQILQLYYASHEFMYEIRITSKIYLTWFLLGAACFNNKKR